MQTDRAIFLTRLSSVFYITKNRASYIPQLSSNLVMTAGMEFYLQKVQLIWVETAGDWIFFAACDCTGHGIGAW